MTQETTEYWERQRDEYLRKYQRPESVLHYEKRRRLEEAISLATYPTNGYTVDIGVGAGELFRYLSDSNNLIGIDFSRPMLRGARDREPNADYAQGSIDALPLQTNAAGTVFCLGVLGHLDPDQITDALAELGRVVEPGGELLLSFANSISPFRKLRSFYSERFTDSSLTYDAYPPRSITTHLTENDFEITHRRYLTYTPGLVDADLHIKAYKLLDEILGTSRLFRSFAMTWLLRATKPRS